MNSTITTDSPRLAELRRTFDHAFAAPPELEREELRALIGIRVGADSMVLLADQITGIAKCRRVVPMLSRLPELIGITGMRGAVVPVFDLAELLGRPPGPRQPSWIALAHAESPIALAFDDFEGQLEVKRTCLYDDESAPPRRHVRQLAQVGSAVRAVIDVPSVVDAIGMAADVSRSHQ
jgi:purine-binding chemotaxis protein CheW